VVVDESISGGRDMMRWPLLADLPLVNPHMADWWFARRVVPIGETLPDGIQSLLRGQDVHAVLRALVPGDVAHLDENAVRPLPT
jgi:hypothetical protein